MPLLNLTNSNFDEAVDSHAIVIFDFWAPWCQPCKGFAPVFEAAAAKYPDILFAKVNTDDEPELARQFEVRSIPTIVSAKNGEIVHAKIGTQTPDKLEAMIEELLKS